MEHLALRHQLAVYQRSVLRPRLRATDRLFWAWVSRLWSDWQSVPALVQPHAEDQQAVGLDRHGPADAPHHRVSRRGSQSWQRDTAVGQSAGGGPHAGNVLYRSIWSLQDEAYKGVLPAEQHKAITKKACKTNHVERFNNTLRQRISRLVRDTLAFSKKLANQIGAITYFICHYNLTRAAALPV
jgi:insertion element IS1 protein InsB